MFLKKPLSQTKKYLLYICFPILGSLLAIQCHKFYQHHRPGIAQYSFLQKPSQRRKLQRKKAPFNASEHLDKAFMQYYEAFEKNDRKEGTKESVYAYFIHYHLREFITDHTDLISSMRTHHPIMDKDTYSSLYLFQGPEGNDEKSYCNLFFKKVNMLTSIGKYHFFMMLAGANNDPERIQRYQAIQRAMTSDPKRLYNLKGIFQELASEEYDGELIQFYLRDKYKIPTMESIKQTIRSETLVAPFMLRFSDHLKEKGYTDFSLRRFLEENTVSAPLLQFLHLQLEDIQNFIQMDSFFAQPAQKMTFNLWKKILSAVTLGWITAPTGQSHEFPRFNTGLTAKAFNVPFRIINYFFGIDYLPFDTREGAPPGLLDYVWNIFSYALFALEYLFTGPFKRIERTFYTPYVRTLPKYAFYKRAANSGLGLLKKVQRLFTLMRKTKNMLQKDKELATLCKPYLKPMRRLLKKEEAPELHDILDEIRKIKNKPITIWDLFSFSTKVSKILSLVKRLDALPEEEEEALMQALTSFCLLETFVSISTFSYENAQRKTSHGFVLGHILPSDEKKTKAPDMKLKGIYSLFINPKNVVKNDMENVRDPKTGEEMIPTIQGLNGAGKSMYLRTILENQALFQAIGCIMGDEAEGQFIDYMRFYANIKDDPAQNLSLMMAEVKKMNELLSLSDAMAPQEKALFILDEPGKGTTTAESGALLAAKAIYLQQKKNNVTIISTHINGLFDIAKRAKFDKLAPFTPGFDDKKKRFTYKIKPGMAQHPVCVHILEKMHFHPSVLKATVDLLAEDPHYKFSSKLRPPTPKSFLNRVLGNRSVEQALILLLILLIGMLLGNFLPQTLRRKKNAGQGAMPDKK